MPGWFDEKFNYSGNPHPGELYKLSEDLAQRNNLWAGQSERIAEMREMLNQIRKAGQVR